MSDNVYERLIDNLMRVGCAVPIYKCEEFTALIKELFTPVEAKLAAALPMGMQPLEAISGHVNRPGDVIEPLLESMADKGLVFHRVRKGKSEYKLMAILPGFFEFQFMKGGTTEDDHKMARLFKNYFEKMAEMTKGATWSTCGVGPPNQLPAAIVSAITGGRIRVGLEDNVRDLDKQHAKGSWQQVEYAVQICELASRAVASPAEAREILKVKCR